MLFTSRFVLYAKKQKNTAVNAGKDCEGDELPGCFQPRFQDLFLYLFCYFLLFGLHKAAPVLLRVI